MRCALLLRKAPAQAPYRTFTEGTVGTKTWRMYFRSNNTNAIISPWHDIPLRAEDGEPNVLTYVNEIPQGTRAKMEMLKNEQHNPICQDLLRKKPATPLRFFTYGDIPFNYGFLPRTWEDPSHEDLHTKCRGDGDPIDAVYLGPVLPIGGVQAVRVLGVLALIDEGETDWKVITEPTTGAFRTLAGVPRGVKARVIDWFRNYKTTDGKPQNEFAFNGVIRGAEEALEVTDRCAVQYRALRAQAQSTHDYWLR